MPVIKSPTEPGAAADRRGMIAFWGPQLTDAPRLLSLIVRRGVGPMDGYGNLWCEMRSMMFAIKAEVSDP
jgi:hypothetical protein